MRVEKNYLKLNLNVLSKHKGSIACNGIGLGEVAEHKTSLELQTFKLI